MPICSKCKVAYLDGEYHNCSEPAPSGKPLSSTSITLAAAFSSAVGAALLLFFACMAFELMHYCWVFGLFLGVPLSPAQGAATSTAQAAAVEPIVAPAPTPEPPARPAVVAPLAPDRYKVQFTVTRETHDKLRRAQDLLRHSIPNGDPAVIFDRALTLLLKEVEKAKLAAAARPRVSAPSKEGSRHVPAGVKREVWERDGGQCAFVGTNGRCTERGFLEYHHVVPFAAGGPATTDNVQLRCRAQRL